MRKRKGKEGERVDLESVLIITGVLLPADDEAGLTELVLLVTLSRHRREGLLKALHQVVGTVAQRLNEAIVNEHLVVHFQDGILHDTVAVFQLEHGRRNVRNGKDIVEHSLHVLLCHLGKHCLVLDAFKAGLGEIVDHFHCEAEEDWAIGVNVTKVEYIQQVNEN